MKAKSGVIPGIERLCSERAALVRGARVGLLAHQASLDRRFRPAWRLLGHAGAHVARLFAPEHGVQGHAQDMVGVDEARDPVSGLPVVSLYGDDASSLVPAEAALADLDALVVDLVDVGARYYTFAASALYCLRVASRVGVRVIVADRPNPIDGVSVEGPGLEEAYRSFVGEIAVPVRHGLTLGELLRLAAEDEGLDAELAVVSPRGWRREEWLDEAGLPFVAPSPNMPTLATAALYPGACLVEGTLLSEGRGTTRPFELFGAPWLDPSRLAARLEAFALPGVVFRPTSFLPGFQKHAGAHCGGVQTHVVDRRAFRPVLTGVALLAAARAEDEERFAWRTETYEFVSDRLAIDLLAGGAGLREAIEAGADPREIAKTWRVGEEALKARREALAGNDALR